MYACIYCDPDFSCTRTDGHSTRGSTRGPRGPKNYSNIPRGGQLLEMFATGTAACIVPVRRLQDSDLLYLVLKLDGLIWRQVGGLLYKGEMVNVPTPTEVIFSALCHIKDR